MKKCIFSNNEKVGSLIFLKEEAPLRGGDRAASFVCVCGNVFIARVNSVKYETTKSCGCARVLTLKKIKKTHGLTETTEYSIWENMRTRCNNIKNRYYKDYGGRGIKVCQEWDNSFSEFYKDMGNRPSKNHSIDRIDNNLGYCKSNCKWATQKEHCRNKRTTNFVVYNGETKPLAEWCEILGLGYKNTHKRIHYLNWTVERAFTESVNIKHHSKNKGGLLWV